MAHAGPELFVDGGAGTGGDGSASAPYREIATALASAPPGGTVITVRAGVYRESVEITKSGSPESPLVIRSEGAVVISGFDPVAGWKDEGGGLFSLATPKRVEDLFVGAKRQRVARFPKADEPWMKIAGVNSQELQVAEVPEASSSDVLYALVYCQAITGEKTYRVTALDSAGKTISLRVPDGAFPVRPGDALLLFNARAFVTRAGEWCCQPDGAGYRVWFRPADPGDLQRTQTRGRGAAIRISGAKHIRLEGLEVSGGSQYGIRAAGSSDIVVSRCVVFANGNAAGMGISMDDCRNVSMDSCIIFGNSLHGIGFVQGENIAVRGCEIASNDGDGIQFSGRRNLPDKPLRGVALENCCIHHHFHLGHPDNSQIFGNVRNVAYRNNLLLLGGQNAMVEECEGMQFSNNAFVGAVARHVILGHGNAHNADFVNNTFAFATFGAIGTAAKGVALTGNVFYQNTLAYESGDIAGKGNLFWTSDEKQPLLVSTIPKWTSYSTPQDFAAARGSESGSRKENPEFKNAPLHQVVGADAFFKNTTDTIHLKPEDVRHFAAGDTIEINGEGVPRKVASVAADAITFAPPLAVLPFRNPIIWKWAGEDMAIELSSSLAGGPGLPGSTVNIPEFRQGKLDGTGKRSLPELGPEAKSAWPSAVDFIYPFCLPQ